MILHLTFHLTGSRIASSPGAVRVRLAIGAGEGLNQIVSRPAKSSLTYIVSQCIVSL